MQTYMELWSLKNKLPWKARKEGSSSAIPNGQYVYYLKNIFINMTFVGILSQKCVMANKLSKILSLHFPKILLPQLRMLNLHSLGPISFEVDIRYATYAEF